jgi:hypothetical protein
MSNYPSAQKIMELSPRLKQLYEAKARAMMGPSGSSGVLVDYGRQSQGHAGGAWYDDFAGHSRASKKGQIHRHEDMKMHSRQGGGGDYEDQEAEGEAWDGHPRLHSQAAKKGWRAKAAPKKKAMPRGGEVVMAPPKQMSMRGGEVVMAGPNAQGAAYGGIPLVTGGAHRRANGRHARVPTKAAAAARSPWIQFVKDRAARLGMSYAATLADPATSSEYHGR